MVTLTPSGSDDLPQMQAAIANAEQAVRDAGLAGG
jgi:hypothetical protein